MATTTWTIAQLERNTSDGGVTEADVLAWVWASVDKDTTEASLAAKIEADKNPTSATGMPWAAE
jgi:hypothetical protein